MEYLGKSPNGLNQLSSSLVGLFVSGSKIADFSSASVNVVGSVTASGIQAYEIDSFGNLPLEIKSNTQITGSLAVSSSISSSLFRGDGSGLFNIAANSIGDIDRIKSGSATAIISPNQGVRINTGVTVNDFLIVTGSGIFKGDLNVAGKINATELVAALNNVQQTVQNVSDNLGTINSSTEGLKHLNNQFLSMSKTIEEMNHFYEAMSEVLPRYKEKFGKKS